MGLRLDPPAHEAVGQMMDFYGVNNNYILKPHVFLFLWTFQPRFKHPAPPQSRSGGCCTGVSTTIPASLLPGGREEGAALAHLCGHMTCFGPMTRSSYDTCHFMVGSLRAGAGPAVFPFPSATGSLQCARWWPCGGRSVMS